MVDQGSPFTRQELARELLRYKMEEYSQDGFCAGWLRGLEWEIWQAVDQPIGVTQNDWLLSTSRECRQLAEIAGGWWVWTDDQQPNSGNPVFVSLDRWREIRKSEKRPTPDPLDG